MYFKILNSKEFYFQKGRDAVEKWLNFELTEEQIIKLKDLVKDYTKFSSLNVGDEFYEIKELIFEIISYCDTHARDKNIYNKYDDKRVLAKAGVRMNPWVQHIVNYKLNPEVTNETIKNALDMLLYPKDNINSLSENHRELISAYYLKKPYDKVTFVQDLKDNFKYLDKPKNEENQTLLIASKIYNEIELWQSSKDEELLQILKNFNKKQIEEYYYFLDEIIEYYGLQENDKRLVFNFDRNKIVFTIGQRYAWNLGSLREKEYKFRIISKRPISNNYISFDGDPIAYLCNINSISEAYDNKQSILKSIEKELLRAQTSGYSKYNKKDLERLAFDIEFRERVLSQLDYQVKSDRPVKKTQMDKNIPLNQILFGAPGTGKTYHTKKIAVEIINGIKPRTRKEINAEYQDLVNAKQIVFTTFHQSLSYEDFIEGIKPETFEDNNENRSVTYEIKNGVFKEICQNAVILKKGNVENYDFDNAWDELISESDLSFQNGTTLELPILTPNKGLFITEITNQGNLKLKPTSNKDSLEYTVSYNRAKKLQKAFPDLSLVKNIDKEFRGVIGGSNSTSYWAVLNYINNKIKTNSNFQVLSPPEKYVLIIDEINRGNVSAIFGELITLLEEDKRQGNSEQIEVTLPYSNEQFSVPNNVYIIGTMNTADRSVEALDTALRRRFSFIEMLPNPEVLSDVDYKDVDLKRLLKTINQRIEVLIDKDHQIGHSYFIGIKNLNDLKLTFKDKIIPLLEEYFYGDFGKIGLVLGGSFVFQEENKAKFPKNFYYENDFLEDKKVYRFTPYDSWSKDTFISIYED